MKESVVNSEPQPPPSGPTKTGADGFPVLAPNTAGFVQTFTTVGGFLVGRFSAQRQPVAILAAGGFGMDDPPIVDRTGLAGKYDFRLEFSRLPTAGAAEGIPPVPDLFTALEQQLGLHLADKKLPFEVLVVDSVDKMPAEN